MNLRQLIIPCIVIVFFFLSLFVFIKLAGPIPFTIDSVQTTKTDTFSVTGQGNSTQKPDSATLVVGVSSQGATVQQVQNDLNSKINKISAAIKASGVDTKDIQTENYTVNPQYDYTSGQKITGYQANTNLTIKIKDVNRANNVIDAATGAGATQVGGLQFDVADKTKAENEARQKAVSDAKQKAEAAAQIAGFKLGRVINYSEDFGNQFPRPVPMAAGTNAKQSVPTQVESGTNEIQVTVTLSYQIL